MSFDMCGITEKELEEARIKAAADAEAAGGGDDVSEWLNDFESCSYYT